MLFESKALVMSPMRAPQNIEFVGGPFDGYTQVRVVPSTRLPVEIVWFVGKNVFQMLAGQKFESPYPLTSVALYECDLRNGRCCYRFVGAIAIDEVLEGMGDDMTWSCKRRH